MSVLNAFFRNADHSPDRIAIEFIDPPFQTLTYAELREQVEKTAGYLQSLGVDAGDRVAVQLPKCLEFILLHLATLRLGAISLPLNPAYPPDELHYFLADSESKLFFADGAAGGPIESLLPSLLSLEQCIFLDPTGLDELRTQITHYQSPISTAQTSPQDTAVIIYTSGTTGRPKGAEITHGNLTSNLQALHQTWGWQADDVLLHVLPLFHVHGLFVALHGALHAGATSLLIREFKPAQVLQTLVERSCTVFMAVPTIHRRLLDVPEASTFDLSGLRLITSGSDRLPDEVFQGFQRTFGYTVVERYGMTETGMNCSNPLRGEKLMGSVGPPLPGVEVRIVDPETRMELSDAEIGELEIRGPNVFKGYWRQPEKTAESLAPDGWFKTGDLGLRDKNGYVILCGRSKDLIISGGLNIYPPEVERVLAEHPSVAACAVIGCPDPEWGERVTAVVVLRGPEPVEPADLVAFCRERLAPYKSPKSIVFADDLPRNAMGKVRKTELRSQLCDGGG
jgi:malonyl-CoA/methylmalonyl-CoA synthetase